MTITIIFSGLGIGIGIAIAGALYFHLMDFLCSFDEDKRK